ncbi:hypothetical protein LTR53_009107 [Teratosphaeriaceae sp. CCFEE 6253]|nr:hypothetical protein LTR53_009107 [Teratosphaeriaceae sp. CCFEE 6253]
MSRDSSFTYIHLHAAHHADLLEDFTRQTSNPIGGARGKLIASEDIYVAPQHQPINPDEEDDVVPDQHAAFGIQRATQRAQGREPAWRDLGLEGLMSGGPPTGQAKSGARDAVKATTLTLR